MVDSANREEAWFASRACFPFGGEEAPREDADDGYGEDSVPTLPRIEAARDCSGDGSVPRHGVPSDPQGWIRHICDDLRDFLLEKNVSYGNSAFEPLGVFSKLDAIEGILLRIDDKLKRIKNGRSYPGDNDLKDVTGYLILLMAKMEMDK